MPLAISVLLSGALTSHDYRDVRLRVLHLPAAVRVAAVVVSVGVREPCHSSDAVRPPSTTNAPPVQKRDRSDARNTVSRAMSSSVT